MAVPVTLELQHNDSWTILATGHTDSDGRLRDLLLGDAAFVPGIYRLTFDTATYFAEREEKAFYPAVQVIFTVSDTAQHYHVPLLLSPFGYSTYRGS